MIVRRLLSFLLLLTLEAWNLAPLSSLRECFAMHSRAAALDQLQPPAEQRSARANIHQLNGSLPVQGIQRCPKISPSQASGCAAQSHDCRITRDPQGMLLTSSVKTVVPPREAALRPPLVAPTKA
jgi:hypothetical protein